MASPLNSLGYKQAVQLLRGQIDWPTALAAVQQAHRNYAKRQMTWFRREPQVIWFDGFGDDRIQNAAIDNVQRLLKDVETVTHFLHPPDNRFPVPD